MSVNRELQIAMMKAKNERKKGNHKKASWIEAEASRWALSQKHLLENMECLK